VADRLGHLAVAQVERGPVDLGAVEEARRPGDVPGRAKQENVSRAQVCDAHHAAHLTLFFYTAVCGVFPGASILGCSGAGCLKNASGFSSTSAARSTSSTCSTGMMVSSRRIFI